MNTLSRMVFSLYTVGIDGFDQKLISETLTVEHPSENGLNPYLDIRFFIEDDMEEHTIMGTNQ